MPFRSFTQATLLILVAVLAAIWIAGVFYFDDPVRVQCQIDPVKC
jgi:hypothetical protein